MDAAVWGFIGTVTGALIVGAVDVLSRRHASREQRRRDRVAAEERAQTERKAAYLQLLLAARRLRYVARGDIPWNTDQVNDLRTEISTAAYDIELIAAPEIFERADRLKRVVLNFLNAARTHLQAGGQLSGAGVPPTLRSARKAAHDEVRSFTKFCRETDLNVRFGL